MKTVAMILVCVLTAGVSLGGCNKGEDAATKTQREWTSKLMAEAEAQVGPPAIKNFQERKLAKMIFELRDQEDLICYAYIVNKMKGELVFVGKCIGFGLPYSVQFTSPDRIDRRDLGSTYSGSHVLSQPDPNGLFMPSGLSATWLMMIDPSTGDPRPVYMEPEIVVSPFKLH